MEELIRKSNWLIKNVQQELVRDLPIGIRWNWRLNGITGARGTGKTTRLLQQASFWQKEGQKVLYATLDDFYFSTQRPFEMAKEFSGIGGKCLLIDEVHKYPQWSSELKNIYDLLPELNVTFSGSSVLQIHEQDSDLSRRALMYKMPGLSFREYLQMSAKISIEKISLATLVKNHENWTQEIIQQLRPLAYWPEYLANGYFPFFNETERDYMLTLEQILKYVIEVDFQFIDGYQPGYSKKIQAILRILSMAPPFAPNISKMAEQVGINRNTMVNYLHYMQQALLTQNIYYPGSSISHLQKPDKVLLANPNLYYLIGGAHADKGSIRESAFTSMVNPIHELHLHKQADYVVEDYVFEIGGRRKGQNQIAGLENAFVVKDDIETGVGNIIPLWAFGFLY
jgi:predicted AAA+ superfamily ATPase